MIPALLVIALLEPQSARGIEAPRDIPNAPPPADLRLVLATPVYQPDGAVRADTTTLPGGGTSLVYLYGRRSLCEISRSTTTEPTDASVGWRVAAHTISQSATEIVVSIDWRRMWDGGQKLKNGPAATQQLVLHPGDSIPLDHIPNLLATSECRAVGMGLEVRTARLASVPPSPPRNTELPLGAQAGGGSALKAEMWLLHTKPSGTEDIMSQTVRVSPDGGTFAFTPMKIATPQGDVEIELTGAFQRFKNPTGEYVFVSMTRVITGGAAPAGGLRQATGAPIALPGPGEVLSFEMPGGTVMRMGGAGGGGGNGVIAAVAAGPTGGVAGGGGQRGGRGAGGGGGAVASRASSLAAQAMAILAGHEFALRLRLTPTQ